MHMPALEGVLVELVRDAAEWADYERRCKAAQRARLEPPAPPPLSLWRLLRAPEYAGARATQVAALRDRRRPVPTPVVLRDHHGREYGLPRTITTLDVVSWLTGEALAHGIGCDYASPYQAWTVIAELVLRYSDIGEIISRVKDGAGGTGDEVKALNADLAQKACNRANVKRSAFGYSAD